ncbi:NlpC/P60 family protein [uncultured Porphyromonas sp.]|uniref:C40 family peptidase n=1 Tax=uncultured Porphyromonas sp. TaxID=159274 RepID=UPI0025977517|nr:NlpC/P60 family protein [uncultured Porphyromonas sp.]
MNHHIGHKWLRIWLAVLLIMAMGSTSCRTYREPVRRVLLPSGTISREIYPMETQELASELSKDLKINIELPEDNLELYSFADEWKGTPYRFGGTTRKGTDCSGFVWQLYKAVYNKDLGRHSSATLMANSRRVDKRHLNEGDLVFFNINNRRGGRASHVGVYLKNDLFVHATTKQGVIISSLNEPYYRRTYIGGGRVL